MPKHPQADLSAADQCVMCGMCQPHCPTYMIKHIETEAPRGRLSMILGLAQRQLAPDNSVIKHLESCTGCGACEAMCPSRVPFMQLMDNSKVLLRQHSKQSLALNTLLYLIRQPGQYDLLNFLLRSLQLGNILRFLKILDKNTADLQKSIQNTNKKHSLGDFYHAKGNIRGNIGLFTGCITKLFDQTTLNDSITFLTHCGYNVHISKHQTCCGAMHQHNGQIDTASKLAQQNQAIFQTESLDAVISTSTGCTVQLQSQLNGIAVFDLMQFINERHLLKLINFEAIDNRLLIHEPCSQRYQLKLESISSLLSAIPGLKADSLKDNQYCCGAGGSNLLSSTDTSRALRQIKIEAIKSQTETQTTTTIVTTNYGCALQLASGLIADSLSQNKQIEICHPISLLVRSASLK